MGGTQLVGRWVESYTGMSADNIKGLLLALFSSLFIGASFIVKKKGLKKAGASGVRAGEALLGTCLLLCFGPGRVPPTGQYSRLRPCFRCAAGVLGLPLRSELRAGWISAALSVALGVGGYSYLLEPLWWAGIITMIVGEVANFAAYAFAPAILVTPLGALSIIISAVLAHIMLREKLHIFGILGCILCVVGSTTIVLHAPPEGQIESVTEVWDLATEPAFLLYAAVVLAAAFVLIVRFVPQYGQTHIMVYIGICSLVGSLSVMSVKALGIALKLTFSGMNQLVYPQTWVFSFVVISCIVTQMNYLNKLRAAGRNTRRLPVPPSPRGLPLIGNLHQVGALPHRALRALAAAHGASDLMGLRLGQVPALVASSPSSAAAIMREHDGAPTSAPPRSSPTASRTSSSRPTASTGATPTASAPPTSLAPPDPTATPARGSVRSPPWTLSSREEEGKRSELFRELIEENTALLGGFCVGDYFPSLAWADALSGAGARACRNFRRWDELLEKVVQEHEARRHGDGDGDEKEEEDFVDVLLTLQAAERQDDGFELTRDAIKSLLADMFAAGTETTFIALEWAMSELVRNPASMHKLQRELRRSNDAIASATAAPYLRAVVKETLRLHPPVPLLLPRECMRDDVSVMGFHVAKGTRVFVNAWAVGRDPASWSAPEEFRPERFLTEEDREVDFRGAHFKFVPFGAGRRVCPGMQFGIATVEHALASLVRMFDWEMPGGAAPEELDMSDAPGLTAHHAEACAAPARGQAVRLRLLGTGRSEEPTT
nr:unnamed protein product [Digitaria exilis]